MITDSLLVIPNYNKEAEVLKFLHEHQDRLDDKFKNGGTVLHMAASQGYALLTYYIMSRRYDAQFWAQRSGEGKIEAKICALSSDRAAVLIVMLHFMRSNKETREAAKSLREYIPESLSKEAYSRFLEIEKDEEAYIKSLEPQIQKHLNAKPLTLFFYEKACRFLGGQVQSTASEMKEPLLSTKKNI